MEKEIIINKLIEKGIVKDKKELLKYNFSQSQLEKLGRIMEKDPDFKFTIFDKLFKLDEFWNLDDQTFKDILTRKKYYWDSIEQQEYLYDIIVDGKLQEWLNIKEKKIFYRKIQYILMKFC